MFDDFRKEATSAYEDEKNKAEPAPQAAAVVAPPKARKRARKILGMTGLQRFMISVMLMLMVCVVGSMFLLLMGRIGF
jgi:ABC-type Na+ efflux pump permease subunit